MTEHSGDVPRPSGALERRIQELDHTRYGSEHRVLGRTFRQRHAVAIHELEPMQRPHGVPLEAWTAQREKEFYTSRRNIINRLFQGSYDIAAADALLDQMRVRAVFDANEGRHKLTLSDPRVRRHKVLQLDGADGIPNALSICAAQIPLAEVTLAVRHLDEARDYATVQAAARYTLPPQYVESSYRIRELRHVEHETAHPQSPSDDNRYSAIIWNSGPANRLDTYPPEQRDELAVKRVAAISSLLEPGGALIITAADNDNAVYGRAAIHLPRDEFAVSIKKTAMWNLQNPAFAPPTLFDKDCYIITRQYRRERPGQSSVEWQLGDDPFIRSQSHTPETDEGHELLQSRRQFGDDIVGRVVRQPGNRFGRDRFTTGGA